MIATAASTVRPLCKGNIEVVVELPAEPHLRLSLTMIGVGEDRLAGVEANIRKIAIHANEARPEGDCNTCNANNLLVRSHMRNYVAGWLPSVIHGNQFSCGPAPIGASFKRTGARVYVRQLWRTHGERLGAILLRTGAKQ